MGAWDRPPVGFTEWVAGAARRGCARVAPPHGGPPARPSTRVTGGICAQESDSRNPCQLVSKGQIVDSLHVLDAAPLAFALLLHW
jgi:hypothetical protein